MTTPTPRSVFVVGDGEGDCLFASGVEQYAKDHFQLCVDEANDFRTGPYTLTEYVPKRDLAARDAELKAIAHHVGGGAFYRDEHGGRLPMRDQVGQHIAELNQQLAARDAELAEVKEALREQTINANSGRVERELWAAKCDELDAMKQRAEAAEMRLKLYEPIHTFNGLTIEEWKRKAEAAERDAFTMAAGQCIVKSGGLMADDHGHQYCDMERQRDEWKRKAEEAARDADAAAIYGNTGRAHGFVGIPKWSELAEETRNLYREALAARAAIAAKGEAK